MPSIPRKQPLAEFLAAKGYWVFYPRYRGAWESGGEFLARSPHLDILDVIDGLAAEFSESAFGQRFRLDAHPKSNKKSSTAPNSTDSNSTDIFVIGGSFGGTAALLCSLDPRVKKVIANCPVVDWAILPREQKKETSNPSYAAYIRTAFGNGYRLSERNWAKLRNGKFYNPAYHAREISPDKVLLFHAEDDPYIPYRSVVKFARITGAPLKLLRRGGHLSTDMIVRKYWRTISKFLGSQK